MNPSSKYVEDENARQTLANGTVLKWSKKNSELYPRANVETDRSIVFTNWNEPFMKKANRGFHQWQAGVSAVYPDMGANQSENYGYLRAAGIHQQNPQPRIDNLFCGVVLSNGGGNYVWGYNPESIDCINTQSGGDRRYLLDMDINKMIFTANINAYLVSDFENIDYAANPSNTHMPTSQNITLKQLYDNPDAYYINTFNVGSCYVYGETGNDHWKTANITPALLLHSPEHTGQFFGDTQYSIFGQFYSHGLFSYDSRNVANHPIFQGGASTMPIYNLMSSGYCVGCDDDFLFEPRTYDYPAAGSQAVSNALFYWGQNASWGHYSYINAETWNYGASDYWAAYGARVNYNVNTSEAVYTEFRFDGRRLLKGSTILSFLASYGLYFMSENFDPDTVNLTPSTLGSDNRIMLGEMSGDGTTTGRWVTDINNYKGINKDGKTSNPTYNPTGGGNGTDGDNEKDVDLITQGGNAGFIHYIEINTPATATANQISDALSQFDITTIGKDLLRNLISYKVFACLNLNSGLLRAIHVDGRQLELNGNVLRGNYISQGDVKSIDLGSMSIPRTYNDFRDFAPYTKIEMYVPFCGWFDLPSWCMGKTITGTMWVDLANGTCKAVIKASKTPVAEIGGNVSYDIPFIANATGAKAGAVISSALATAAAGVGAITTPNFASVTGAIAAGANLASALNANSTTMRGVLGDGSNTNGISKVWIKVTRPKTPNGDVSIPSHYRHVHGSPCGRVMKLATGDGYTQILDANITGAMTDREKQMIIDGFKHGLIL